eukprot:g1974.t1
MGRDRAVRALLHAGADANMRASRRRGRKDDCFDGWERPLPLDDACSPLDLAVRGGHLRAVEALCKWKSDVGLSTLSRMTFSRAILAAAHFHREAAFSSSSLRESDASGTSRLETLALLLRSGGADSIRTSRDDALRTPLHHAVASGSAALVSLLLSYRVDVNAADASNSVPLHMLALVEDDGALGKNAATLVAELAASGASVNHQNVRGRTPLYSVCASTSHRCRETKIRIVEALLSVGGDPTLCDRRGLVVLDVLRQTGERDGTIVASVESDNRDDKENGDDHKMSNSKNESSPSSDNARRRFAWVRSLPLVPSPPPVVSRTTGKNVVTDVRSSIFCPEKSSRSRAAGVLEDAKKEVDVADANVDAKVKELRNALDEATRARKSVDSELAEARGRLGDAESTIESLKREVVQSRERAELWKHKYESTDMEALLSGTDSSVIRGYLLDILKQSEEDALSVKHLLAVRATVATRQGMWALFDRNIDEIGRKFGLVGEKDESPRASAGASRRVEE